MPRLVIKATRFVRTQESNELFNQRGWRPAVDRTTIPSDRKLVGKDKLNTPLFGVELEEWEYGD